VQVKGRLGVARAVVERGWWLAVVVMRAAGPGAGWPAAMTLGCDGSGRRSNGDVQTEVTSQGRGGVPGR
jgi:hypothetical protein